MATFTSVDAVAEHLLSSSTASRRLIGIVGSPGAGKSTIAEALVAALPGAALLPMDGYHFPQAELRRLGRRERMGAPDTFDVEAFVATLERVRTAGGSVSARGFDRTVEEPVEGAIVLPQESQTIIVEGNYLLVAEGGWGGVAPLLDETFTVELAEPVRHARLIARHIRYGKSETDARAWALGPDEHNASIIAASAHLADHTITLP